MQARSERRREQRCKPEFGAAFPSGDIYQFVNKGQKIEKPMKSSKDFYFERYNKASSSLSAEGNKTKVFREEHHEPKKQEKTESLNSLKL